MQISYNMHRNQAINGQVTKSKQNNTYTTENLSLICHYYHEDKYMDSSLDIGYKSDVYFNISVVSNGSYNTLLYKNAKIRLCKQLAKYKQYIPHFIQ